MRIRKQGEKKQKRVPLCVPESDQEQTEMWEARQATLTDSLTLP
jgi:hypothetical protein